MQPNREFVGLPKAFWAHVRSLSQALGYTARGTGAIAVPTLPAVCEAMQALGLGFGHLVGPDGRPTSDGAKLLGYFQYRADILNNQVQHDLMDAAAAEAMYLRLSQQYSSSIAVTMNKQKGEKKKVAYLTAMVNLLIEAHAQGTEFNHDPRALTTVTRGGLPLRTLARRVDGAFPSVVNPVAIWEIKEYYHTTTFGSRVADGVYETLLDGMELEELREHEGIDVQHLLVVDAHYTWWDCGRSYLCRIIDMLHMGYVDEVIFGREIERRLPQLVQYWVQLARSRQGTHEPTRTRC